jgi:hypothetical protein
MESKVHGHGPTSLCIPLQEEKLMRKKTDHLREVQTKMMANQLTVLLCQWSMIDSHAQTI